MDRQSKEESVSLFSIEMDNIPTNDKLYQLAKTVKPLIEDYTITYDEWKSDIADSIEGIQGIDESTKEGREEIVTLAINQLIGKYKEVRYNNQVTDEEVPTEERASVEDTAALFER